MHQICSYNFNSSLILVSGFQFRLVRSINRTSNQHLYNLHHFHHFHSHLRDCYLHCYCSMTLHHPYSPAKLVVTGHESNIGRTSRAVAMPYPIANIPLASTCPHTTCPVPWQKRAASTGSCGRACLKNKLEGSRDVIDRDFTIRIRFSGEVKCERDLPCLAIDLSRLRGIPAGRFFECSNTLTVL
jgi:hypothetical protein